jgi:hypothetical protein
VVGLLLGGLAAGGYLGLSALAENESAGVSDLPPEATIKYEGDQLVFEMPEIPLPTDGPYYKGQLGDFLIVGGDFDGPIVNCLMPVRPVGPSGLLASDLYASTLGRAAEGGRCGDGKVVAISNYGDRVSPLARGRLSFEGTPKLVWDAPKERLQLLTVAGLPAIAESPAPDNPGSKARLAVVQRFPSQDKPGILVWVDSHPDDGGLDAAIELAQDMLEERSQ